MTSSTPDHDEVASTRPATGEQPEVGSEATTVDELVQQWEDEKPPAAGTASNLAAAGVVAALGLFGLVSSFDLGVGSASSPGPGTWPAVVSVLLVVLAALLAVAAPRTADAEKFGSTSWLVALGLATMVGFALSVGTVGFEIPAALLAFVWLKVLGREGWRTSIVTSVVVTAAFYLIFVVALGTPIPHLF